MDVWSLGVVLYICLCGFPPFSDELYTLENPYTLSQQIKMGRFDYPSPYWDSVGDPALALIDKMLTVDVDKRITIDECLEDDWITQRTTDPADSTGDITGGMSLLDFSKRKYQRERTMLSSINNVKITKVIEFPDENSPVKVYEKNPEGKRVHNNPAKNGIAASAKKGGAKKEDVPAANRQADEFMEMGGQGDQPLFGNDTGSRYAVDETPAQIAKT